MAPPTAAHRPGRNLALASSLALLSYVPFEAVAKLTLAVCAVTFVADPFPPASRLVSVASVAVVAVLARALRRWQLQQEQLQREESDGSRPREEEPTQTESGQENVEKESKKEA
jgi:stringent starvation protein B